MPNDEIRLTDPICEPQVSKMWPVGDVWFLIQRVLRVRVIRRWTIVAPDLIYLILIFN